jgi:hypothetical protein
VSYESIAAFLAHLVHKTIHPFREPKSRSKPI